MPKQPKSPWHEAMGVRIKNRRELLHLRLKDVGNAVGGLTATAIGQYERGEADPPASRLPALAAILQCTVGYILGLATAEEMQDDEVRRLYLSLDPAMRNAVRLHIEVLAAIAPRMVIYDENLISE